MKKFLEDLKYALPAIIYMAVYLLWFFLLEERNTTYTLIHTSLDDKIPFCEYFVIPYYLWFVYVFAAVVLALITDRESYEKSLVFLITGMTAFLLISTLFPNGQNLRPATLPNDNFCSKLVSAMYRADTPTNLWPSIHVYNSIGAHLCILSLKDIKHRGVVRNTSLVLSVLIILSTMFIKQHSTFDVFTAMILAGVMAIVVYRKDVAAFMKETALFRFPFEEKPEKKSRFI